MAENTFGWEDYEITSKLTKSIIKDFTTEEGSKAIIVTLYRRISLSEIVKDNTGRYYLMHPSFFVDVFGIYSREGQMKINYTHLSSDELEEVLSEIHEPPEDVIKVLMDIIDEYISFV